MEKKRKKAHNTFSIKALLMKQGYLVFFLPAIIGTFLFVWYYYSAVFTSIAGVSTGETGTPSTQITSLTDSVEEKHAQRTENALEFAKNQSSDPFGE